MPDRAPDSRPIAYLVPEFPQQTHAFFWREIAAIEDAGAQVALFSTRRPPLDACPHPFRDEARARTQYLFPPRPGPAAALALRPVALARATAYVAGLRQTPARGRARLVALIPSAADLAQACRAVSARHLHVHSCADAAHLAVLAHRLGGPGYSLTLHGDLDVYGTDHAAKMGAARFVSTVTGALAAQVAGVAPGVPNPVIWMGVDTDRFRPRAGSPPDRPFTVVTVARLAQVKGHRFLLRALARLRAEGRALSCVIAGDGPDRDAILAEIAALSLGDCTRLTGAVAEDGVRDLLHGADALALTSIGQGEAAPVAVMEAMACGLPVVASVIGGTPDMIRDGHDGLLVPQQDVEAIVGALRGLMDDPARRAAIGRAARARAVEAFDHHANALKLLERIDAVSRRD